MKISSASSKSLKDEGENDVEAFAPKAGVEVLRESSKTKEPEQQRLIQEQSTIEASEDAEGAMYNLSRKIDHIIKHTSWKTKSGMIGGLLVMIVLLLWIATKKWLIVFREPFRGRTFKELNWKLPQRLKMMKSIEKMISSEMAPKRRYRRLIAKYRP